MYLRSSNVRSLSTLISRTNRVASERLLILGILFRYCCILIAPGISMRLRARLCRSCDVHPSFLQVADTKSDYPRSLKFHCFMFVFFDESSEASEESFADCSFVVPFHEGDYLVLDVFW